jgi:hypothetical protein
MAGASASVNERGLKMLRLFALVVFLTGMPASAAQTPRPNLGELEATLAAAQAAANRPGDASLNCDALQSELVETANQPAVQSYVARSGAAVQERAAASSAAAASVATQMALTLFSSIVPGGAWVGFGANVAQAEAQRAQSAINIQQHMQQAQEMMAIMPQLMRGQRVIELAQARNCGWLGGASSR